MNRPNSLLRDKDSYIYGYSQIYSSNIIQSKIKRSVTDVSNVREFGRNPTKDNPLHYECRNCNTLDRTVQILFYYIRCKNNTFFEYKILFHANFM